MPTSIPTNDFANPADALAWLIAMGADEIVREHPLNRFEDSVRITPPPERHVAAAPVPVAAASADTSAVNSLSDIVMALNYLEAHPLKKSSTKLSFYEGPDRPRILLLSDYPRKEEDRSGLVFADKARLLVSNMLSAIGLKLEDVGMMNLLPWRVLGGRAPNASEVLPTLPFAVRAVELLQPQMILAFSALPGHYLAGGDASIQRQRGKWLLAQNIPLLATLHPEELLRTPTLKRQAWRDLQLFQEKSK